MTNCYRKCHLTRPVAHPLASRLVAAWAFAEGGGQRLVDSTGLGNETNGVNGIGWGPGHLGVAARFASNAYFDLGDRLDMGTDDFTLSVKIRTTDTDFALVAKSLLGAALNRWGLVTSGGTIGALFNGSAVSAFPTFSTSLLNDNKWHTMAAVFDRDANLTVYLDGASKVAASISADNGYNVQSAYNLLIGRYNDATGGPTSTTFSYTGDIENAFIWRRALSPTEIVAMHVNPYSVFTLNDTFRLPAQIVVAGGGLAGALSPLRGILAGV